MGVWSYDFVEAQTHDGRKLRLMTLIDEFTRSPPFGASANLTMPCHTGAAVRARHTSFACGHAQNLASCTASSATQCRSNPVSGRCLSKTGIFQISAGDFRQFRSVIVEIGSLETPHQFEKVRHWRAFFRYIRGQYPVAGLPC